MIDSGEETLLALLADGPRTRAEIAAAFGTDTAAVEPLLEQLRAQQLVEIAHFHPGGEFGIALPQWRLTAKARAAGI